MKPSTIFYLTTTFCLALSAAAAAGDRRDEDIVKRGVAINKPALPLSTVLASPEKFADQEIVVDARVRASCTRKGCWMELAPEPDSGAASASIRVFFKDYAFFVPLDSKGKRARVLGTLKVRVVTPDEVAHMESEGGRFVKGADGSAKELRLTATGVELRTDRK